MMAGCGALSSRGNIYLQVFRSCWLFTLNCGRRTNGIPSGTAWRYNLVPAIPRFENWEKHKRTLGYSRRNGSIDLLPRSLLTGEVGRGLERFPIRDRIYAGVVQQSTINSSSLGSDPHGTEGSYMTWAYLIPTQTRFLRICDCGDRQMGGHVGRTCRPRNVRFYSPKVSVNFGL